MNPSKRMDWDEAFADLRAWIDSIVPPAKPAAECADCGGTIYLIRGKRSGKFFWSHEGWHGCQNARAIMFDTREAAEQATEVFL